MKYIGVVAIIVSFFVGISLAQEITVVTEEWPPFNYTENGKVIGIATEVVEAVFAKAQLSAPIKVYPWARAYHMALIDANVVIYTIARIPEREPLFHWIGPITPTTKERLYKLRSRSDIVLTSLEDAKKYQIGVLRAGMAHQLLLTKGFEENMQIQAVPLQDRNIKKLFAGRIDLIAISDVMLPPEMKKIGESMDALEETSVVLSEVDSYMAFSKSTPIEVVERVRTAFRQVKATGLIEQVSAKYLTK